MKLGSQTGSVMNHLYSRMVVGAPEPEVGMGATILAWTDRYAATVVSWDSKKKIIGVTMDSSKLVAGSQMSEEQEYEFVSNMNGIPSYFKRDASSKWVKVVFNKETNRWNKSSGNGLRVGDRDEYRDPCF